MAEQPTQEIIEQWNRWFAVECNNRAWDLIEKANRTPAEDREMLHAACASAFHWSKVGKPIHSARGEVTLSFAHALLGHPGMALHYAKSCLHFLKATHARTGTWLLHMPRWRKRRPSPAMRNCTPVIMRWRRSGDRRSMDPKTGASLWRVSREFRV